MCCLKLLFSQVLSHNEIDKPCLCSTLQTNSSYNIILTTTIYWNLSFNSQCNLKTKNIHVLYLLSSCFIQNTRMLHERRVLRLLSVAQDPREALIVSLKREVSALQDENEHLRTALHLSAEYVADSSRGMCPFSTPSFVKCEITDKDFTYK